MRVSRKNLPKSVVELTVDIPAPQMQGYFQKALQRLASQVELQGFRKGKAPLELATQHIPARTLLDEAAELAVRESYPAVLSQERLEALGSPQVEVLKIARGDEFSYRVRVAVLPEVKLPDYKKFRVRERAVRVEEKELQDALFYLQKSRATWRKVDRGARIGDFVEIDFTIRQNNVIIEDGSAANHPFMLGEGRFIPGFEEALAGMRQGEEKQFPLTFPADYARKEFAGKLVECAVKLHTVQERLLTELSDEFTRSVGKFESAQALRASVESGLRQEKEEREGKRAELELISQIARESAMEVPGVLAEREVEKMFEELASYLASGGLTLEAYLLQLKRSKEELASDWRGEAEKRVRIALALRAVAREEGIVPSAEEMTAREQEVLRKYVDVESAEKDFTPEALQEYIMSVLTNEKVLEFLHRACIVREMPTG